MMQYAFSLHFFLLSFLAFTDFFCRTRMTPRRSRTRTSALCTAMPPPTSATTTLRTRHSFNSFFSSPLVSIKGVCARRTRSARLLSRWTPRRASLTAPRKSTSRQSETQSEASFWFTVHVCNNNTDTITKLLMPFHGFHIKSSYYHDKYRWQTVFSLLSKGGKHK